jgi:hypothetical protein
MSAQTVPNWPHLTQIAASTMATKIRDSEKLVVPATKKMEKFP